MIIEQTNNSCCYPTYEFLNVTQRELDFMYSAFLNENYTEEEGMIVKELRKFAFPENKTLG